MDGFWREFQTPQNAHWQDRQGGRNPERERETADSWLAKQTDRQQTSPHLHIFPNLTSYIFTSWHLLIFTSSHLHIHLHIFSSSHFSSSHLLRYLLIFTSSHPHIFSSSHPHIFIPSHHHICSSWHLLTFTSIHFYILTSSHLLLAFCFLALLPSCSLALLPSCPLLLLNFSIEGAGQCQRDGTIRNPCVWKN